MEQHTGNSCLKLATIAVVLLHHSFGYDGCMDPRHIRCGDVCHEDKSPNCFCGLKTVYALVSKGLNITYTHKALVEKKSAYCCSSQPCSVTINEEENNQMDIFCPDGVPLPLSEPCNNECNYFPEDIYRNQIPQEIQYPYLRTMKSIFFFQRKQGCKCKPLYPQTEWLHILREDSSTRRRRRTTTTTKSLVGLACIVYANCKYEIFHGFRESRPKGKLSRSTGHTEKFASPAIIAPRSTCFVRASQFVRTKATSACVRPTMLAISVRSPGESCASSNKIQNMLTTTNATILGALDTTACQG